MKNKLGDLNEHLYKALERVNEENLSAEDVSKAIEQGKAVQGLSNSILSLGRLVMDGMQMQHEQGGDLPDILSISAPKPLRAVKRAK